MAIVSDSGVAASESEARLLRIAAACGVAGQVGFVLLWIVWGFVESDYSVARQDISDFGALDASHPLPYNVILSITGLLTVVLAFGLYRRLRPGIDAFAASVAVVVFGAGDFLDGLLREDCSPSGNAACRAAAKAGDLSWHHTAHDLESLVTILSITIAPILLGFAFRRRPAWADLAPSSFVTALWVFVLVVAYTVIFVANDGSAVSGLIERGATLGVLLFAVVSWRLWQMADVGRPSADGAMGGA